MKLLKGAGAIALGLALMLTRGEAAGLNIKGLNPQLRATIGQLSDNRPVILARAPYAVYNVNVAGGFPLTVMSFVFPPDSLVPGDMIRISLSGVTINNNAGANNLSVTVSANNGGGASQPLGGWPNFSVPAAGGNPNLYVEWKADFMYSVGVAYAVGGGNYVPRLNESAVTAGGTYSSGLQSVDAISFYGGGFTIGTTTSLSGGVFSGGILAASSGGLGLQRPIVFQNSLPIEIDVQINSSGFATMPVTINAGVMEGL